MRVDQMKEGKYYYFYARCPNKNRTALIPKNTLVLNVVKDHIFYGISRTDIIGGPEVPPDQACKKLGRTEAIKNLEDFQAFFNKENAFRAPEVISELIQTNFEGIYQQRSCGIVPKEKVNQIFDLFFHLDTCLDPRLEMQGFTDQYFLMSVKVYRDGTIESPLLPKYSEDNDEDFELDND
jgi:hypothetical protein